MRVPLYHVNAFTNRRFSGNPAAVCPLQGWLDDGILGKVAAENNLSETAFFVPEGDQYALRWFTPRCEVRLCGHATLAAAYVVLSILQPSVKSIGFQTRFDDALTVTRDADRFAMDFPALPTRTCTSPPEALLQGLARKASPSRVLEANDTFLLIYENQSAITAIRPNMALLEQLHPFCVAVTAPGDDADFVSRYFAPSYGIPEDPVTGSAHCILAPYWCEQLGKTNLYAQQISDRGGELWCEVRGGRVILKGAAVLTLQGSLQI